MEAVEGDELERDYIPLILQTMAARDTAQRKLALLTGINKSRLGLLLHSDPNKRSIMTQPELEKILRALGTNICSPSAPMAQI